MQKHRATKAARYEAYVMALEAKVPCWPNARILVEFWPPSFRGDPSNAPISAKAYIDGIADAMGCDDKGFEVDFPTQWAGKKPGGEVVFHIERGRS